MRGRTFAALSSITNGTYLPGLAAVITLRKVARGSTWTGRMVERALDFLLMPIAYLRASHGVTLNCGVPVLLGRCLRNRPDSSSIA